MISRRYLINEMIALIVSCGALLTLGCEAAEMSTDEYGNENDRVNEGAYDIDQSLPDGAGYIDPAGIEDNVVPAGEIAGEIAGDTSGESGGEPECEVFATPNEALESESSLEVVCLDELLQSIDAAELPNPDAMGESPDTSASTCGLAGKLSETFSAEGVEVICTDADGDCYYVCEGWTLPDTLRDLDDSRDFITNGEDDVASAPAPEGQPCLNLDSSGVPTCCSLNDEDAESILCRVPLPSDEGAVVQRVQICQGGAFVWVSERDGELSLHATHLDVLERDLGSSTSLNDELNLALTDLDGLTELQCKVQVNGVGSRALSVMLTDSQQRIYNVIQTPSGQYQLFNLYSEDQRLTLIGGAQGDPSEIELNDTEWSAAKIKVNDQGIFSWELSVTPRDGEPRTLRYISYQHSNASPIFIPDAVVDHAIKPTSSGIEVASLDDLGALSFAQINQDMLDPITYEASRFNRLVSSTSLLAQTSSEPSASARFFLWGSDNFWEDADSTLRVPLVVSAAQLGFETLEIGSISGMMTLLKLSDSTQQSDSPEVSSTWGLYDIMSDRLHLFDWEMILSDLFEDISFTLKAPKLVNNRVFWIEETQPQGDDSSRQLTVISAQINR